MTDKTDTEMTISKSYSCQAVNRLCKTMTTPVSKSVNLKADDRRAETILARSSDAG